MSKSVIAAVAAVIVIAGGLIVLSQNNKSVAPPSDSNAAMDMPATSNTTTNSNTTPSTQPSASDKVVIADFAFGPSTTTVKKGTTVTWTNNDATRHDVTPDNPTDEFKASELLSKGQSYSVTFNTAGTYSYHCSPHPQMKGIVIVE